MWFYMVSRGTNDGWAFSWVLRRDPLQHLINTGECKYEHRNMAEEDPFKDCVKHKYGAKSVVSHTVLAIHFIKIDTQLSMTSNSRPSQTHSRSNKIRLSLTHASEIDAVLNKPGSYCQLKRLIEYNLGINSNTTSSTEHIEV